MISVKFFLKQNELVGFSVSGHANFAERGEDIVCSAVTSAVQMACNTVTEIVKEPAKVKVLENEITLEVTGVPSARVKAVLEGLELHLKLLQEDYKETIQLTKEEV